MKTKVTTNANPNEVPASLPPEFMDKLADIVVAKLIAKNQICLLSKQAVAGSIPASRSIIATPYIAGS